MLSKQHQFNISLTIHRTDINITSLHMKKVAMVIEVMTYFTHAWDDGNPANEHGTSVYHNANCPSYLTMGVVFYDVFIQHIIDTDMITNFIILKWSLHYLFSSSYYLSPDTYLVWDTEWLQATR